MATSQSEPRTLSPIFALVLAALGAASMLYYHQGLFMRRVVAVRAAAGLGHGYSFGNDFYQIWLTARECVRQRRDPYSPEMTREIQTGLYGRPLDPRRPMDPVDRRVFPYPAYADLVFFPTAAVPFPVLRWAVLVVLATLTIASVFLWLRAFEWHLEWPWIAAVLLLTMTSYSALEALFAGQIGLLVAFLLAASIVLLRRDRFLLAGILMALATLKPQVTALAIVFLLLWTLYDWHVRRRFVVGFFSTLAILFAASLAWLPGWIQSWIHTVLAYRHYTRPPLVTEVLTSPLGPRFSPPATFVLTAASVLIAVILAWRGRVAALNSFQFWITLTLLLSITTITILPGQAVYDHLILVPGILLLVRYRRDLNSAGPVPRFLLGIGAIVFFWQWIVAFLLISIRPLLAPATFYATSVFSLPLHMAASLPFVILALLGYAMRIKAAQAPAVA